MTTSKCSIYKRFRAWNIMTAQNRKENENGRYVVGYFPSSEQSKQMEYSDLKEACAAFVKREIEEIGKS